MMLTWIAYAMLCAAAIAALAAGIDYALGARVRVRRAVWFAAIVVSAILPVGASVFAKPAATDAITTSTLAVTAAPVSQTPRSDTRMVLTLWATASALMVAWLAIGQLRLRRGLRNCTTTTIAGCRVLVSPEFGPAVVGVVNPQIVLPAWTLALSEAERHLVLTHEMEHRSARDSALLLVGALALVLFPWNAAIWWQFARLRLAIEFDCDARVVRHGHDPFAYGRLLVFAGTRSARPVASAIALVQMRSDLGRRIDALVARRNRSTTRAFGAVGLGVALIASLAFAPAPRLPNIRVSDTPSAAKLQPVERQVERNTLASIDTVRASAPRVTSRDTRRVAAGRRPALTIAGTPTIRPSPSSAPAVPEVVVRVAPIPTELRLGARVTARPGGGVIQMVPNSNGANPPQAAAGGGGRGGRVTAGGFGAARLVPRDSTTSRP